MLAKVWREGKNLYGSFSAHYHHWGVTDKKVYWLPKLLSQVSTSRMALLYRSNSLLPLSPNKGLWVMAQSPMISKSIHRCESDSQKAFMYYYVWLAKQYQIYWFWWLSQMPILNTECHSTIFIALPIWKWRKYTALSHEKGLTIMSTIFLAPHYNLKCSFSNWIYSCNTSASQPKLPLFLLSSVCVISDVSSAEFHCLLFLWDVVSMTAEITFAKMFHKTSMLAFIFRQEASNTQLREKGA